MSMEIEPLVQSLAEKVERHWYGKYRGYVEDNRDPKNIGRLRLRIPAVFGDEKTGWAMPCVPYGGAMGEGMVFIPEKDAGVWVEFEEGNLERPIWVGMFWGVTDDGGEMPLHNNPDGTEETEYQVPPSRKIIRTKKGHTIQLEDKDGEELITIVHWKDNENNKKNVITMDASGIKITDYTENVIEMKEDAFTITSKVAFTIDASGQAMEFIADAVDFTKG